MTMMMMIMMTLTMIMYSVTLDCNKDFFISISFHTTWRTTFVLCCFLTGQWGPLDLSWVAAGWNKCYSTAAPLLTNQTNREHETHENSFNHHHIAHGNWTNMGLFCISCLSWSSFVWLLRKWAEEKSLVFSRLRPTMDYFWRRPLALPL